MNTFSMSSRESFSSILRVIMARNSAKSVHDGAVAIAIDVGGDHLLELLVLDLEAKGAHDSLELTHVNLAGCISMPKPVASASIRSVVV